MTQGEEFVVWGVPLRRSVLTNREKEYLSGLPERVPPNEWVWTEMDRVWNELNLVNTHPMVDQPIGAYYRHPVWLMNGIFSVVDPTSAGHRRAIAQHIETIRPVNVADYGGGFGELAVQITQMLSTTTVSIIEPYPSAVARDRLQSEDRITLVPDAQDGEYDVIVAQDVLEHVEDPIDLAIRLAGLVRSGGTVIFANNFTPVIQCHLPATFHLRYSFPFVMAALGLRHRGNVAEADHAQVYEVGASLHPRWARIASRMSQIVAPVFDAITTVLPVEFTRNLGHRVSSLGSR